MAGKKWMKMLSSLLLGLGGLNWLLVGLLNYNLVESLLGGMPWLVKTLYVLIGASALPVLWDALSDLTN